MSGRVNGKGCIVTGGARGLGQAIAATLVNEGATVLITDIDAETGKATAIEIGAEFLHQDTTDEARWLEIIEAAEDRFGGLDVLVNNAGIAETSSGVSPEDTPLEAWRRMFAVNVEGVFLGCRAALPALRRAGGGSIINLSSIAGMVPTPFLAAYGASKAAVMQLSTSVALHGAPDKIRCNSVHPGQVQTDMHNTLIADVATMADAPKEAIESDFISRIPLGEFSQASDIANAVLFLASDESRHITGTQMVVDGGMQLTN